MLLLVRAARQRHLANRHALRVSGSNSYALLFLLKFIIITVITIRSM